MTDLPTSEQAIAVERLKAGDFIYERALYPVFEYAFKHPLTHEVAIFMNFYYGLEFFYFVANITNRFEFFWFRKWLF